MDAGIDDLEAAANQHAIISHDRADGGKTGTGQRTREVLVKDGKAASPCRRHSLVSPMITVGKAGRAAICAKIDCACWRRRNPDRSRCMPTIRRWYPACSNSTATDPRGSSDGSLDVDGSPHHRWTADQDGIAVPAKAVSARREDHRLVG